MIEYRPTNLAAWRLMRVEKEREQLFTEIVEKEKTSMTIERGPWDVTPGLLNRMADLYEEGHSTRVIAEKLSAEFSLDITRNAVIGKSRRARYKRAVPIIKPAKVAKGPQPPAPQPIPERPPEGSIAFDDLAIYDCRYPFGEVKPYSYCGRKQVYGSSYCLKHDRLARPGAYRR